ncbi:MAG TPA: kelch repeat-containing protein, partial [Chloroflexota bacterium]|nr:kelch repeat-containing protein [Chloroflexota bacterium]
MSLPAIPVARRTILSIWRPAIVALLLLLALSPRGVPAGVGASSAATWNRLTEQLQPPARSQFGMTIDRTGTLYVYGGRGPDSGPLADFWRLRHGDTRWQQLSNTVVPALIEPHLAADAAGNVFEFGGIVTSDANHVTADGHSYGLYEYVAAQDAWTDVTTATSQPSGDWPQGREDHGFAYDAGSGDFYVFAGEGSGESSLNDMWRYDERTHLWTQIKQRFDRAVRIDAREIYNITPDNHGGIWLFGGAYLFDAQGKRAPWGYVNDLWRFDIATSTWHLVAGQANAYDPSLPVPRHYYGQAADAEGNFYILGGYLSAAGALPYFDDDDSSLY